jgi:hypothetical protein
MTNNNPTGYYEDGETEDYTVLVDDFPLKVNLLSFNAKLTADEKVKLEWTTSGEENFNGFEVQRSADNTNWTVAGNVYATGNGNTGENDYSLLDLQPLPSRSFYRLRLISGDGKFRYSEIRTVTIKKGIQEITLSPNPASDITTLTVLSLVDTDAGIMISDMKGRSLYEHAVDVNKGMNTISLPFIQKLNSGMYIVQVRINGETMAEKLIVNRK